MGYWFYAPAAVVLLVRGLPLDRQVWELHTGWNLVGPPADMAPIAEDTLAAPVWGWDPVSRAYRVAPLLARTSAFWIFAMSPLTVDVAAVRRAP
jgi:hypothetical protein